MYWIFSFSVAGRLGVSEAEQGGDGIFFNDMAFISFLLLHRI
jgi:hypothetical protein